MPGQDIRSVWTGLRSYGFDLHREHVLPADSSHLQGPSSSWTNKQDEALMKLANNITSKSNIIPLKNGPNEIYLTKAELDSEEFKLLQGISIEDLRTRFSILCTLNSGLEKFLIPLTDFQSLGVHPNSSRMTQLTDRDTKKGKCKGVNPKSSNTRYFGCREALENLKLHGVTNEGETEHHGLPFKAKPIVTGTKQALKLVAIKPGTTNIPANVAPKTLHDVIYEFSRAANNLIKTLILPIKWVIQ